MLGRRTHGPIPWPWVTRKRFVRELEAQGAAYRANVAAAEQQEHAANVRLRSSERMFAETVRQLSGWYDGNTTVTVQSDDGGPPEHFKLEAVRDLSGRRYRFVYDVSDTMIERMRAIDARNAGKLMFVVTEGLVAEVLTKLYYPET